MFPLNYVNFKFQFILIKQLFGQTFIFDDKFLAFILSASAFFNATSRFFWGFLIDRISFKVNFTLKKNEKPYIYTKAIKILYES